MRVLATVENVWAVDRVAGPIYAAFILARSFSPSLSGRQLMTSVLVSQPLRAMPMPTAMNWRSGMLWASGLMAHLTPSSLACFQRRQSMSRRYGWALISMILLCFAAAAMTW